MHARYLGSNFALKLNLQTYLVVSWKVSKIIFEIMKTYGGIPERSSSLIFKLRFTIGILVDWILLDAKGSHRPKWIIWQILKYFIIGTFHKGWKWNKYLFSEDFYMSFHFNLYLGTFTVSQTKCAISKWMWPKPLLWQAKQVMLSVGILLRGPFSTQPIKYLFTSIRLVWHLIAIVRIKSSYIVVLTLFNRLLRI